MSDDLSKMLGVELSELGDAIQQMQETYADGIAITKKVNTEAVDDIDASHQIIINIELSATVQSKKYYVDAELNFLADLNTLLNMGEAPMDEIAEALGDLDDVDLGDEEETAVLEQLAIPRALGVLDGVELKDFELSGEKGLIETGLNEEAALLITMQDGSLLLNFENVFTYPKIKEEIYYAIPSGEKMQENIVVELALLNDEVDFEWEEKDKDGLTINGSVKIKEL